MTGTTGPDSAYPPVGCHETGYGIPSVEMIDALMRQLEAICPMFHRKRIEGVGIYGWNDGFHLIGYMKSMDFIEQRNCRRMLL